MRSKWEFNFRQAVITASVLFLLAVLLFNIGCSNQKQPGDAYILYNPYADINWKTVKQFKANFHTHTLYNKVEDDGTVIWPDGRVLDPGGKEIQGPDPGWEYGDKPRSVYRKSDGKKYGSDGVLYMDAVIDLYHQAGYKILAITDHDDEDYGSATSWPWTTWFRDPDELRMLAVEGNEISRPEHLGSFFNDYGDKNQASEPKALEEIQERNGLAILFHPGRYIKEDDPRANYWYEYLFLKYGHAPLIGMEVFNQGIRYEHDQDLWDRLNALLAPEMVVFGYSNDDMHRSRHLFHNYQFMLMDQLTEEALKEAMHKGSFYFCYEYEGSGEIVPPVPLIEKIEVAKQGSRITITAPNAISVKWFSEKGLVGSGHVINLNDLELEQGKFIRAELTNEFGITCLQPFTVGYYE